MSIGIIGAQIEAASGKHNEALRNLLIAIGDAARFGFVADQFQVRLAHADIELKSGRIVASRAELETLRKDAAEKGIALVAQKATALMPKKQHGP